VKDDIFSSLQEVQASQRHNLIFVNVRLFFKGKGIIAENVKRPHVAMKVPESTVG